MCIRDRPKSVVAAQNKIKKLPKNQPIVANALGRASMPDPIIVLVRLLMLADKLALCMK